MRLAYVHKLALNMENLFYSLGRQKQITMARFEDFQTTNESFDAVFFVHCAWHFGEQLKKQIQRGLDMTKKGGRVVVVLAQSPSIVQAIGRYNIVWHI